MSDLAKYNTIIFDCDGVILNSNFKKIEAYRNAALEYGASSVQAEELVNHHIELTGMSEKITDEAMKKLVNYLNEQVLELLKDCEVTSGLRELKNKTKDTSWMVASGGDQKELRYLFKKNKIDFFFSEGIYGSPSSKHEIIEKKIKNKNFYPALFLGDSLYDIQTAKKYNLDFIFVYGWTDLKEWKKVCEDYNLDYIEKVKDLI